MSSWLAAFCAIACSVCVGAEPKVLRIVTLAPNLTELTFTAGAGGNIVGAVEFSDFPDAARAIPRVGDAFRVDFERVLALHPDVVLSWEAGTSSTVVERLRALKLNVRTIATFKLNDVGNAVREIGKLAGTSAVADVAALQYEQEIAALRAEHAGRKVVSVFLQVNDKPLYTVNGQQIMSELVELCGGRNVFADLDKFAPEIGIEAVIAKNPQAIVATEAVGGAALAQWQRWTNMDAVKHGNVFSVPPDDVTRATTRLARGARAMCRTLETAREHLRGSR